MTNFRHPEKVKNKENPIPKKPPWIRVKAPTSKFFKSIDKLLKDKKVITVCEEAACPNIAECWQKKHATFMILGDTCTRACSYCNVKTGWPGFVDKSEPFRVAMTIKQMGLEYVVITSVDRDDLEDAGSEIFAKTISETKKLSPQIKVEVLTPDFNGDPKLLRNDLVSVVAQLARRGVPFDVASYQSLEKRRKDLQKTTRRKRNEKATPARPTVRPPARPIAHYHPQTDFSK